MDGVWLGGEKTAVAPCAGRLRGNSAWAITSIHRSGSSPMMKRACAWIGGWEAYSKFSRHRSPILGVRFGVQYLHLGRIDDRTGGQSMGVWGTMKIGRGVVTTREYT